MSTTIIKLIDNDIMKAVSAAGAEEIKPPYLSDIKESLEPIKASRNSFSARKQIIGMVGPGRSGKSTLINSLIGSTVSPIGKGYETTARPSIVMYSRTPGIEIYFGENDTSNMSMDECCEAIRPFVDLIKGYQSEEAFRAAVASHECNKLSLSTTTLRTALTGMFPKEPLMVVVKTPEWVLKTDQLCFIDFPGLDGFKHNYHKNPNAYALLRFIDFLILNQSTFSGLDRSMVLFLKRALGECDTPPMWLVHNKVEAKTWQEEDLTVNEAQSMIENTKKIICSELEVLEKDLPVNIINLGKAHDGIFSTRESLFHESQFENFETTFMGGLHSRRLQSLLDASGVVLQKLPGIRSRIESDLEVANGRVELLERVQEQIQKAELDHESLSAAFGKYGPINLNQILAHLRSLMQNDIDFTMQSIKEECSKKDGKLPASYVNKKIAAMIGQLEGTLSGFNWTDVPYLAEPCCKSLDDLSGSVERTYVDEANKELEAHGLRGLHQTNNWTPRDLPSVPFGDLRWVPLHTTKRIFGFIPWPRHYSNTKIEDHVIYHLFGNLMEQNVKVLDNWRGDLKSAFLKITSDKRKNGYLNDLGSIRQELSEELEATEKKCRSGITLVDSIVGTIRKMSDATRSELSALQKKKWSAKV